MSTMTVETAIEQRAAPLRRPLQPHGTTARAYGRPESGIQPCDCTPCVTALRRYKNQRQALRALGHPGYVPAARAARHVRALADTGMTWTEIVAASGISHGTLSNLLRDDAYDRNIGVRTQERILAVPLPVERRRAERRVDGTGTRRRRQGLARLGWSSDALAGRTTLSVHRLRRLQIAPRVTAATRDEIRALYVQLENTPGPSVEAARRAERKGWVLPAAWDGLDIDDPRAVPDLGARSGRPLAVAEDVEFIVRTTGVEDRDLIAARLGITRDTLDRNLDRASAMRRDPGADDAPADEAP